MVFVKSFSLSVLCSAEEADRCVEVLRSHFGSAFNCGPRYPVHREDIRRHFNEKWDGPNGDLGFHFCGEYLLVRFIPIALSKLPPDFKERVRKLLTSVFPTTESSFHHSIP